MRILIVDDEAPARRRLTRMLATIPAVTAVAEAEDAAAARHALQEQRPDLVLLDIQMPEEDGLTLAASTAMPAVVFVTAHDEHAVRAFELAAIDYLLKPVTRARLEEAIERVRARAMPVHLADALRALPEVSASSTPRVAARSRGSLRVFDARMIARFTARDKYTVFVHDGAEFLLDHSLGSLEARLAVHEFLRVHRRELINLAFVAAVHVEDGAHIVELRGGDRVPVSRRLVATLKHRLGL